MVLEKDLQMLPAKSFYMIRHGETEHNIANVAAGGETNSALTAQGHRQAKELRPYMSRLEIKPSKIFHSSLDRARETAQHLNLDLDLEMIEIHDLREMEIGDWAGLDWEEVGPRFTKHAVPPNGESSAQFSARVQRALSYCLEQTQDIGPPLIVGHGGLFFGMGIMYDIYESITHIDNCRLHYFDAHHNHPYFPWKVIEYVPSGQNLQSKNAPFCATRLPKETPP